MRLYAETIGGIGKYMIVLPGFILKACNLDKVACSKIVLLDWDIGAFGGAMAAR